VSQGGTLTIVTFLRPDEAADKSDHRVIPLQLDDATRRWVPEAFDGRAIANSPAGPRRAKREPWPSHQGSKSWETFILCGHDQFQPQRPYHFSRRCRTDQAHGWCLLSEGEARRLVRWLQKAKVDVEATRK